MGATWAAADTRRLLAVTLAALILFTYGLGVGTLWDQDEPKYAQISREILQTGDLFTLHFNGKPWFVHPPLFMWLQALTGKLFGFSEFTVRIWSSVSGAGIAAATFLLARFLYDATTGVMAGAITATTIQVLAQSRLGVFDPTLLFFMLLALYMYLVAYETGSRRAHLWAWVWAGLATTTKGPIGLILPAMVVVALWAVRREWSRWREIPILGPVIFAAVGLPWYVIETFRHGEVFLRLAVGHYLFGRFFGVVENQPGVWWYYIPVLLFGAFPWTASAPSGVAWLWRRRRELGSQIILLWCGITVAFYSAAGTKLPNYVLPVYPVLAIGIARLWMEAVRGTPDARRLMRWVAVLLPVNVGLFVVAIAVYGWVKYSAEALALRGPLIMITAVFTAGSLVALGCLLARRTRAAFAALALALVVAVPVLARQTLPAVEQYRPIPRIARGLRAQMQPGDVLAAAGMSEVASLRYYSEQQVEWVETPADLAQVLCRRERVFLVVPAIEDDAWVRASLPPGVRLQGEDGGYRILLKDQAVSCSGARPAP